MNELELQLPALHHKETAEGGVLSETKPCTDWPLAIIPDTEERLVNIYWIG